MTPTSTDAQVMELTVDAADLLLSMGVSAVDVVAVASRFSGAYARRPIHVDVISSAIIASQDSRGGEPGYTVIRPVNARTLNYRLVEQVSSISMAASAKKLTFEQARRELDDVTISLRPASWWASMVSAGLISAGVGFLFGVDVVTLLLTFFVGCVGERVLAVSGRWGLAPLLAQAVAALLITLCAVGVAELCHLGGWNLDATPLVVGGIVMLVVGMMFVSAFQDALDEFYVTAGARLLKVLMLTLGIVLGIAAAISLITAVGLGASIQPEPLPMGPPALTIVGAALIAGAYASFCRANLQTVLFSLLIGAVVWVMFLALVLSDVHEVPAAGATAMVAGLAGTLVARRWRIPSMAVITAGIVTMVPGLRLFNGLLQVVTYPLWSTPFFSGLTTLVVALGIGVSIAVGASIGATVGRPLRQRLTLLRRSRAMSGLFRR